MTGEAASVSGTEARAWDRGAGTARRASWLAAALRGRIAPGTEVLELGTGTGLIAEQLTLGGLRVCGIDPSAELAAVAAGRLVPAVIGDGGRLPFRPGRFGAVVSAAQRAYERPGPVLAEADRVLRRDGQHVIAVPDPARADDDPIGAILRPMRAQLGRGRPAATLTAISQACADLGLPVATERLAPFRYQRSPAREAQDIASRSSSLLWGLDEATWARVVRPAIEQLLALPAADQPLARQARYVLVVIGTTQGPGAAPRRPG